MHEDLMADRPLHRVLGYLLRVSGGPASDAPSDGDLLTRFLNTRDQAAFEALLCRHAGLVWAVCRRGLTDRADVEDAFQATFLVLLRKARTLDGSRSLAGWLYAVAQRVVRKAREQSARRAQKENEAAMRNLPVSTPPPESLALELDAELARIPEKYRAPLVLCYLEGKTNEQAAQELGWPLGSISKRLARGRDLLRHRLVRRGVVLTPSALAAALAEASSPAPPAALTASLTSIATGIVTGAPAAPVPAAALTLAEGVLRAMLLSRIKTFIAIAILSLAVLGTGVKVYLLEAQAEGPRPRLAPLPAIAIPASDPLFEARNERMPLELDSDSIFDRPLKPMVTVGYFDDVAWLGLQKDKPDRRPPALPAAVTSRPRVLSSGAMDLEFAREGRNVHVHLVGPRRNSGEWWVPVALTRQDSTFTLLVESWNDNRPRFRNVPAYDHHLLALGTLPAGDYDLKIVWRSLFDDHEKGQYYRYTQQREGTLRFRVAKADAKLQGKLPSMEAGELKEVDLPKALKELGRQGAVLNEQHWVPDNLKGDDRPKAFDLRIGTFDYNAWAKGRELKETTMPRLEAPRSDAQVYALPVGPELKEYQQMTLRGIAWEGKKAILQVDVWLDNEKRTEGAKGEGRRLAPKYLLLGLRPPSHNPFQPPASAAPGEYEVEVEWSVLRAETRKGPYKLEESKRSQAKFKVE